ncbi:unnamed protein product, partial [Rotaria sordida]
IDGLQEQIVTLQQSNDDLKQSNDDLKQYNDHLQYELKLLKMICGLTSLSTIALGAYIIFHKVK